MNQTVKNILVAEIHATMLEDVMFTGMPTHYRKDLLHDAVFLLRLCEDKIDFSEKFWTGRIPLTWVLSETGTYIGFEVGCQFPRDVGSRILRFHADTSGKGEITVAREVGGS